MPELGRNQRCDGAHQGDPEDIQLLGDFDDADQQQQHHHSAEDRLGYKEHDARTRVLIQLFDNLLNVVHALLDQRSVVTLLSVADSVWPICQGNLSQRTGLALDWLAVGGRRALRYRCG